MVMKPNVVERAFQLAREGRALPEIRKTLRSEGYDENSQRRGRSLIADLKRAAKAVASDRVTAAAPSGRQPGWPDRSTRFNVEYRTQRMYLKNMVIKSSTSG